MCGLDSRVFLLEYVLNTYSTLRHYLLTAPKYSFLKSNSLRNCSIKPPRNISVHRWQKGPFKFSEMNFVIFVCHTSCKRGNKTDSIQQNLSLDKMGSSIWKLWSRRESQPNIELLPGKSHGQRSLAGYSPLCCKRVGLDLATNQQQNTINRNNH